MGTVTLSGHYTTKLSKCSHLFRAFYIVSCILDSSISSLLNIIISPFFVLSKFVYHMRFASLVLLTLLIISLSIIALLIIAEMRCLLVTYGIFWTKVVHVHSRLEHLKHSSNDYLSLNTAIVGYTYLHSLTDVELWLHLGQCSEISV